MCCLVKLHFLYIFLLKVISRIFFTFLRIVERYGGQTFLPIFTEKYLFSKNDVSFFCAVAQCSIFVNFMVLPSIFKNVLHFRIFHFFQVLC